MPECTKCKGLDLRPCFRTSEDDKKLFGFQCLTCGSFIQRAKKSFGDNLPIVEFDRQIKDEWLEARHKENLSKQIEFEELRIQKQQEWRAFYESYLTTEAWQTKRMAALVRDRFTCQGCFAVEATEVHHLTYNNLGDELLFQLISLCSDCHRKVHQK